MENLAAIVHEAVLGVAQQRSPAIQAVKDQDRLVADLGLKSLDLAQLVAVLEVRTGLDPFAERVAITSVRSVGDLVAAYRGDPVGQPTSAPEPRTARSADARKQAADRRRQARTS